jgi:hypothetical protein
MPPLQLAGIRQFIEGYFTFPFLVQKRGWPKENSGKQSSFKHS